MSEFTDVLTKQLEERSLKMSDFNTTLPAGDYEGKVFSQRFYENDNGTPLFEIGVQDLVNSDPDSFAPVNGDTRRYIRMPLTDRASKYTVRKLKAIGYEGSPSQFNPDDADHISLVGKTVNLYMKIGSYGEDWDISTPRSNEPMDNLKAKQWDARFSHLMPKKPQAPKQDPPTAGESSFG
jgi:hypothetical protein